MKENEKERWLKLTYRYMTEESDDEENSNSIILHKIEWRSDSEFKCPFTCMHCLLYTYTPHPVLNKYIDSLDQCLAVVAAKDLPGNVAKKVRKIGEPSTSAPPLDAPAWAIKKPLDSSAAIEGMLFM